MFNLKGLLIALVVVGFTALAVWAIVTNRASQRTTGWAIAVLAVVIVAFCAYGMYMRLSELYAAMRADVVQGDSEGAFAFTPLLNYFLASVGFLFLLVWAAFRGMFHDIEQPKRTLLENEEMLDRQERMHLYPH